MIRCCLCASWFHEECVGIQCDADRGGVWPCPECRQNGTRVKTLIGTIEGLVSAVRVIGEQLATSERERRDERIRTEERAMALRKEVVTLKEQVATLTWRTFRQPGQPSSLLIGSSLVRNVSRDKLVDTDVICLPGGKLADVKRKLEQQPSGFDTITVLAGGNDCDTSPPPSAEAVVEAYSAVIDTALVKARTVIVSSVCPRLTTHKTTNTIDAVNADLVHLCDEKSVTFIDNTPLFTLSDGSVNDGYLQRDGVHLTTTAINRVAKNLALKIICAEDGACGQARPPPPPTTRRSDKRDISNHKDDDDIVRRPQPRRPNRVAKNQAQKIICTEDGACGQARPLPPPTTRRSDKRDISNHTYDDDIARRPQSRRSRHADNDENGWQTVRRQPPRRGPTYCHFCGEGGHVKDNCRHGAKLECHSCGQLGHKEKFCAHY